MDDLIESFGTVKVMNCMDGFVTIMALKLLELEIRIPRLVENILKNPYLINKFGPFDIFQQLIFVFNTNENTVSPLNKASGKKLMKIL